MDIGFIFPSCDYLYDPFRGDPHTHFQVLTVLEDNFGGSVNVSLIDLRGIEKKFALQHISAQDVYLHSVYTLDYHEQVALVEAIRERYPKALHIAGGPHANLYREECLDIFDTIILGDGEEVIQQVIKDIRASKLEKLYRQDVPVDINLYLPPRRNFLPIAAIAKPDMLRLKNNRAFDDLLGTTVIFSRGCPYHCHFCEMQLSEFSRGIRYRNANFVEDEIEYLKKEYQIKGINVLDEISIPLSSKKAIEHLEAIGRTDIFWRGQCRVDGLTPDIVRLASESGCIQMSLGIESASQQSLDIINKKIQLDRAKETISLLKENGIETRTYFVMGLPGEPENIVDLTWSFIQETNPDMVFLSLFAVRPGTEVFNNPQKFGIKEVYEDWDHTMHLYGRFEEEEFNPTFEYESVTPWGKGMAKEQILDNFQTLLGRLKQNNLT
jgi:anaerobic magnesium-protoporphyrin IX monomethyl ester cyclase